MEKRRRRPIPFNEVKGLKDFHVHTVYCDGRNTSEEMIEAAIAGGMAAIGFSGHSYVEFDEKSCMSRTNTISYSEEVRRLAEKYRNEIKVYCGIERDYFTTDEDAEGGEAWDYIIGSVHYVEVNINVNGVKHQCYPSVDDTTEIFENAVEKYFDGDVYSFCEAYFETVACVQEKTDADIIGHFDLITKFNAGGESGPGRYFDENHPRYVAAWQKAADRLLEQKVLFEINTGGMFRGYRKEPYPAAPIQRYIAEKGGKFILSGDSHSTDGLCYAFDDFRLIVSRN